MTFMFVSNCIYAPFAVFFVILPQEIRDVTAISTRRKKNVPVGIFFVSVPQRLTSPKVQRYRG